MKKHNISIKYIITISFLSFTICLLSIFLANANTRSNGSIITNKKNMLNSYVITEDQNFGKNSKISSTSKNKNVYFYHNPITNSKNTQIIAPLQKQENRDTQENITITPEIYIPIKPRN